MTRTIYFGAALLVAVAIAAGIVYATQVINDDLEVTGDLGVGGDLVAFPNATVTVGGDMGLGSSDAHINFTGSSGRVEFQNEGHITFDAEDSGLGFGEFGGANFGNGGLFMFFKPAELGLDAESGQLSIAARASAFGAQLDSEDPPELRAFIYASAQAPEDLPIGGTDYMLLNVCTGSIFNWADTGLLALGNFTAGSGENPPAYSGAFLFAKETDDQGGAMLAGFNASTTGGGANETAPYASIQAMDSDGKLVASVTADEAAVTIQSLLATEGESIARAAIVSAPTGEGQSHDKAYVALQAIANTGTIQGSIKIMGTDTGPARVKIGNSTLSGVIVTEEGDILLCLGGS